MAFFRFPIPQNQALNCASFIMTVFANRIRAMTMCRTYFPAISTTMGAIPLQKG